MDEPALAATAADYLAFAGDGARGRSLLYEELARRVAEDREVLAFLVALPPAKRQPNLLFAAVRHLTGTPADWPAFRRALFAEAAAVRALMLARRTQTNEPGRCATLLPVLARLPQPLALLEVGTSGGLCLLPDYYGYDYGRRRLAPADAAAPILSCLASEATPLPDAPPVAGSFLLSVNGAPVAWTDPHGRRIDWLAPRSGI